jgi:hypothetical protein
MIAFPLLERKNFYFKFHYLATFITKFSVLNDGIHVHDDGLVGGWRDRFSRRLR